MDFLAELAGGAEQAIKTVNANEDRRTALEDFATERDALIDEIRGAMDVNLIKLARDQPKGFAAMFQLVQAEETVRMLDKSGDPNKELDTGHEQMGKFAVVDEDKRHGLMEAQRKILEMQKKLTSKQDADGNPLFDDTAIAEEVWQPLVRARIIPENAVPPKYSEVTTVFKGASAGYDKQLAKFTKTAGENAGARRVLAVGQKVSDAMNQAANAGAQILAGLLGVDQAILFKDVADLQALIADLTPVAFGLADQALKGGEFDPAILAQAATAFAQAFTVGTDLNPGVAETMTYASMAFSDALQGGAMAKYLAKKPDPDYDNALKCLGNIVSGTLGSLDPAQKQTGQDIATAIQGSVSMKTALVSLYNGDIPAATKAFSDEFSAIGKNFVSQAVMADYAAPPPGTSAEEATAEKDYVAREAVVETANATDAITAATDVITAAGAAKGPAPVTAKAAATKAMSKLTPEQAKALEQKNRDSLEAMGKLLKLDQAADYIMHLVQNMPMPMPMPTAAPGAAPATGGAATAAPAMLDPATLKDAKALWDTLTPEHQEKLTKAQVGKARVAVDEQLKALEADQAAVEKNAASVGGEQEKPTKVEQLTAKLKLNEAKYQLAIKLASLPFAVVSALIPPAKMGQTAILWCDEFKRAAKAGQEYLKWKEHASDAKRANTVMAEAFKGQRDLASDQGLRHGIECCFKAIQIVGQALTAAGGPLAPVGVAVSSSAVAASAAKAATTAVVDEHKAAEAWSSYQDALDNPNSRKAMRKAIRNNPTLAKNAIAYGAKNGNLFAKQIMQESGVTAQMLAEEKSTDKLVELLQARLSEDPTILRVIPTADWFPGDKTVKLTAKSWLEFVTTAEATQDLVVMPQVGAVAAGLKQLEAVKVAYEKKLPNVETKDTGELLKWLFHVNKLVEALKPVSKDGKENKAFTIYLKALKTVLATEIQEVKDTEEIVSDPEKKFRHREAAVTSLINSALREAPPNSTEAIQLGLFRSKLATDADNPPAQGLDKFWQDLVDRQDDLVATAEKILKKAADAGKTSAKTGSGRGAGPAKTTGATSPASSSSSNSSATSSQSDSDSASSQSDEDSDHADPKGKQKETA